jgi:SAM-dependent methyltransferase
MDKAEFDRFADEYQDQHRQNISITGEVPEYFSEYKIRKLEEIVTRNKLTVSTICDFGSGIGNSIPFFQKHFPNAVLTSADVSQRSLELSRIRYPSADHLLLIENNIPVKDSSFDVAFSACVFHHIPSAEHVFWLSELHRVTRPGGLIAIFEHNPLNPLTVRAVNSCPFDVNAKLILATGLSRRLLDAGWTAPTAQYNVFFPRVLALLRPVEKYLHWLPLGAQYVVFARKGSDPDQRREQSI